MRQLALALGDARVVLGTHTGSVAEAAALLARQDVRSQIIEDGTDGTVIDGMDVLEATESTVDNAVRAGIGNFFESSAIRTALEDIIVHAVHAGRAGMDPQQVAWQMGLELRACW